MKKNRETHTANTNSNGLFLVCSRSWIDEELRLNSDGGPREDGEREEGEDGEGETTWLSILQREKRRLLGYEAREGR
jgi:hypothetical protein